MITFGVDPDNATCVLDGDRLMSIRSWKKGIDDFALCRKVQEAVDVAVRRGAEVMAIEGQFIDARDSEDKATRISKGIASLKLSRRAGFFVMEWLRVTKGSMVVTLQPQSWYSVSVGKRQGKTSKERKKATQAMVKSIYGATVGEDEADAIGIARAVSIGRMG